jgi:hypothetical protein
MLYCTEYCTVQQGISLTGRRLTQGCRFHEKHNYFRNISVVWGEVDFMNFSIKISTACY